MQGSNKRAHVDPYQHELDSLKEGEALMGNILASVIVSPEMQSYAKGDNVTLHNKSVEKSLTFPPQDSANVSGYDHVIEALSGMEVKIGVDAEDDLFDEGLKELEAKSKSSMAAGASKVKGSTKVPSSWLSSLTVAYIIIAQVTWREG
ncbi:unnamed protein product [Eruca vesicaria subsp. sativa]|uniref:Uncharacterized protein n=1 Tax=Eruca vesicaria subsp. sativa TaxID=29727 RepID=A0ABC8J0D4_ERUVS|nr:unnamed protein product [Eruca vesicaria subsp. sativa]